jgi:hypothetical protein
VSWRHDLEELARAGLPIFAALAAAAVMAGAAGFYAARMILESVR